MSHRHGRLAFAAALLVALASISTPLHAAGPLSEKKALAVAVDILKGDPYGDTDAAVIGNIRERRLVPARETTCGGGNETVWAFHVVAARGPGDETPGPIDGWLVLNASTGEIVCAGLPFLD